MKYQYKSRLGGIWKTVNKAEFVSNLEHIYPATAAILTTALEEGKRSTVETDWEIYRVIR